MIQPETKRPRLHPATPFQNYRRERGIRQIDLAVAAGIPLYRIGELERHPDRAKPGELDRLRQAVDRISAMQEAER